MNFYYWKKRVKRDKRIGFYRKPRKYKLFEYSVVVTSLENDVVSIIDHYRDRADCENNFDEIETNGVGGWRVDRRNFPASPSQNGT